MYSFFVKVYARDRSKLRALQTYGFDLFQPTVMQMQDKRYSIDGLLQLDEIQRLVLNGYQVLVEEESSKRARGPREVVEFDQWRAARKKR
jgi:hypothetical protein